MIRHRMRLIGGATAAMVVLGAFGATAAAAAPGKGPDNAGPRYTAGASGVGALSEEELALVERATQAYRALSLIPCTGCAYCMPCPNGVDIPHNFKLYNDGAMYERENPRRMRG